MLASQRSAKFFKIGDSNRFCLKECKMFFFCCCSNKTSGIVQSDTHKEAALKFVEENSNKDMGQIICVSEDEINFENSDSQIFFHTDALRAKSSQNNLKVVYD